MGQSSAGFDSAEGFHQILAELIRQRGIDSEPGVGGGHEWYFWLDTANLVFYLFLFFFFS